MAVEYPFAAHPTRYGGVLFRSRLEATWAAFFDLLEWRWEYEPFDLKGWVPDFMLRGQHNALVEIKPITEPDADTIDKIMKAAGYQFPLILGGVAPPDKQIINGRITTFSLHSSCCCGPQRNCWMNRAIAKVNGKYDIVFGHDPYIALLSGVDVSDTGKIDYTEYNGDDIEDMWRKARNITQWRPPR